MIAKRTGAKIIANGEAINCMRQAGVPEEQFIPVAGGEQIPLGDSGIVIRPYPALHCLMTFKHDHSDVPDFMDTSCVYLGNRDACTWDITKLMTIGALASCSPEPTLTARRLWSYEEGTGERLACRSP